MLFYYRRAGGGSQGTFDKMMLEQRPEGREGGSPASVPWVSGWGASREADGGGAGRLVGQ